MAQCEIPLSFLNTNKRRFWKKSVAALEQVIVQALERNNRAVVFPVNHDKLRTCGSILFFLTPSFNQIIIFSIVSIKMFLGLKFDVCIFSYTNFL